MLETMGRTTGSTTSTGMSSAARPGAGAQWVHESFGKGFGFPPSGRESRPSPDPESSEWLCPGLPPGS